MRGLVSQHIIPLPRNMNTEDVLSNIDEFLVLNVQSIVHFKKFYMQFSILDCSLNVNKDLSLRF